jgi:hypothetical protein
VGARESRGACVRDGRGRVGYVANTAIIRVSCVAPRWIRDIVTVGGPGGPPRSGHVELTAPPPAGKPPPSPTTPASMPRASCATWARGPGLRVLYARGAGPAPSPTWPARTTSPPSTWPRPSSTGAWIAPPDGDALVAWPSGPETMICDGGCQVAERGTKVIRRRTV